MDPVTDSLNHVIGVDLDALIQEVHDAAVEKSKKKAKKEYMEEMSKVVLAERQEDVLSNESDYEGRMSATRAESIARTTPEYKDHLKKLARARVEFGEADAAHFLKKNLMDAAIEKSRHANAISRLTPN